MNNAQNTKLKNLLSIACKAGRIMSGEFVIEKALSGRHNIKLLLLAADISPASQAKYEKMASAAKVRLAKTALTKDELAGCIGKTDRAAAAVCDEGFSKAVLKIMDS